MIEEAKAAFQKGKDFADKADYAQAEAAFREAVHFEPWNATYHAWLGSVLSYLDRHDEAIQETKTALEMDNKNAIVYRTCGIIHANKDHNYQAAIKYYDKAIELDQYDAATYFQRGLAYSNIDKYAAAVSDFSQAIELNPYDAETYFQRGTAYLYISNYDAAINDLSRAIALNIKEARVYNHRGIAYMRKDDYDAAISDLSQAIALNPKSTQAYYYRSRAAFKAGKIKLGVADEARMIDILGPVSYKHEYVEVNECLKYINDYVNSQFLPFLKKTGERLIIYYPGCFTWSYEQGGKLLGSRCAGYIGLTNLGVRLGNLGQVSRVILPDYPLYARAIMAILRRRYITKIAQFDRDWVVPYGSITDLPKEEDQLNLRTEKEQWAINPLLREGYSKLYAGIRLGMDGKMANIWEYEPSTDRADYPSDLSRTITSKKRWRQYAFSDSVPELRRANTDRTYLRRRSLRLLWLKNGNEGGGY